VATPEALAKLLEFREELVGSFALEGLHKLRDREEGRCRDEEMDMILGNGPFDDFHILAFTDFSEKIPKTLCHLSVEHLFSVLGNPHQVVLEVIHRMRSRSIILHLLMVLKSSP
jgi:hypothetical protein